MARRGLVVHHRHRGFPGRRPAADRPGRPDRDPVRVRRPRVRGREERPRLRVRQSRRHDADAGRSTCARTSTTSGIAACSAWRCTRTFRRRPTSTSCMRTTRFPGGTAPQWGVAGGVERRLPDAARGDRQWLRGHRAPLALERRRLVGLAAAAGERTGAGHRLVPAVPQSLDRIAGLRRRRRALRERRRRRQLQLRRLRTDGLDASGRRSRRTKAARCEARTFAPAAIR